MIKKLSLLMLLMAFFVPWAANAQTTVEIGDGTSSNPTLPVHMVYAYSLSQQIYTAEEIGMDGSITSIAFYHNPNTSLTMEDIQVYMMEVDKSAFESNTDIVPLTNATKVYEGTLSANGTGWVTLQFSTPFPYDGESNLLVCCYDPNSNKPGSSEKFNTTGTTDYTSLVYYSNTHIPDLNNISAYSGGTAWYKYRNNIQLEITPNNCQKPTGLNVTLTPGNGTTAVLNWTSDANAWQIMLNDNENNLIDVTQNPYTLTGLTPETTYTARVRTVCDGENGMSSWSNTVSFTPSERQIVTIGSGETTNTYLPAYTFYNYNLSEQIYTAEEVGMAGAITSISFYNGGSEKSPEIAIYMVNTDQNEFSSNTSWLTTTESDLVFGNATVTFTAGDWTTIELDTPFEYDGTSNLGLIVDEHMQYSSGLACSVFASNDNCSMYVYSDNTNFNAITPPTSYVSGEYNGRLSVKNQLKLEIIPAGPTICPRPTRLTCTGTTDNTATLSWIENGEATEWQICLNGNENNPITITENPYTLTNLIPETAYTAKVRANCGDEDGMSVWSNTVSFTPSAKVIITGNQTGTNDYLPFNNFYNYSLTQQIYTIEELGVPGFIRSIDFFKPNTTAANRNLSIYMVNTDKDSFTGTSDWISVTSENLVFSGTVNFANNDWTTITLDDYGFLYDGTQNVAIIVDDNTGSYESTTAFSTFTTSSNQAIYVYNDNTNYDPMNPPSSGTMMTSKNQIRILKDNLSCMPPFNPNATDITSSSAVLNWTGDAESYNVSYYKAYFFDSFEEDLSQWTIYKEGDDDSWEWGIENPNDNSADLNAHGGSYAAVAYSDINVHADNWLVSPQILFPNRATLKFWIMRSTYDDAQDEYEVRLSTTGNAVSDFSTILKEKEAANSTWTEVSIDLSAYDGQQGYIAIRHDFTGGFFIMVDDFGIFGWSEEITTTDNSLLIEDLLPETEYLWHVQANCSEEDDQSPWVSNTFTTLPPCPIPFDLTVSEITANGATIAWTGYNDSYNIWVGEYELFTTNYDFEDHIISTDFTNSTSYPWTVTSNDKHSGTYSVMSGGAGTNSATSDLNLEVIVEHDATLSFWARISSEASFDKGYFSIDGVNQSNLNGISGDGSWINYTYTLEAGSHTLRWYYSKDSSVNSNDDCFYVDDIIIQSSNVSSWITYTASESPFILNDATKILPETTYMVKVKGFCGDEATEDSESITFTTLDESTRIFVIEGDWSDSDNWVPAGVPSIDDDVILRAEATVFDVAEANIITIEGTAALIIEDGGQLKTNTDIEATMKKFIIGYGTDYVETNNGYYLMALPTANPISAADAGLITEESGYDLYSWDRTATDEEWQNHHDGIDLQNGIGFLYSNRDDMEMSFTATLRNSSDPVVVTPSYDEVEHGGWNLCGNPFPCEAYITTDAEGMTFYRLVDNELVPIEGAIAPLEAFFVKATAAGQTFTISREAPAK